MEMSSTKIKDRANLDLKNTITMTLQGLTEEDRQDLETKLEIEMREYEKKLLVCYRKTENGVVRIKEFPKSQMGLKPTFAQEQKPINVELSANEEEVDVLDLPVGRGAFVLPGKFHANEVDKHQDDGARSLEDK
ncbi:hypothetical protein E2562_007896 [Oryza meyeriana var. granulata]|uniref:Uncharacterized protein n=1 Tax=Oryza meyeriana var. granulata TaxID=110450 RepID=A0A6G1DWP0_9ORYZ|nr:hypothetical protein E2562_007896 [Oryza meyeriana var. granulata]